MSESKRLTTAFAALGDPTRLAIVERLLRSGEASAGDLNTVADISPPAMSRHLRVLREAGLVRRRVQGKRRIYSAVPEALGAIDGWAMSHRRFWAAGLDRLDAALDAEDEDAGSDP